MNKKPIIITSIIIVLLFGLLIVVRLNHKDVEILEYNDISEKIEEDVYSVIYFGKETDEKTDILKSIKSENNIEVYYANSTLEQLNTLLKTNEISTTELERYILFMEGVPYAVVSGDVSYEKLFEQIGKYFYGEIPTNEIVYKVPNNADQLLKKINGKEYTVTVIGSTSCHYCALFKQVFNNVATAYNLDIFYIDTETYDQDEYAKIQDLDFDLPEKCTYDGEPTTLSGSIPKPLTIITKKGKLVDCIRGYVGESLFIEHLKAYEIIEEE